MLYTGKGDNGTTKTLNINERVSKDHKTIEALGSLDETNSFLGIVRCSLSQKNSLKIEGRAFSEIIFDVQQNLFIIQAEIAGASINLDQGKVVLCEQLIASAEKNLPPITSFLISGEGEGSSFLDYARTLVRKTERRIVAIGAEPATLAYLNRLSSLFYTMARLANHLNNKNEKSPNYK